jgi:cytochrome c oxidase subunit 2
MNEGGTLWLPESASTLSPEVDTLFYFVTYASAILFVGVVGAMVYLAVRYRRTSSSEVPEPVQPSKFIEISWIVVPTILVLIVFNWGFKLFITQSIAPPESYEIRVTASMWRWDFEYPDGTISTGELHVPANRPVRMVMSSTDVLHSFFIPVFRVKQDVLPDRYSSVWFEATRQGEFDVYCTEYCGTGHSAMLSTVIVESQSDLDAWLETAGVDEDTPLPEYGAQLYEQQMCIQCHSIDGTPQIGPTLQGLYGSTEELVDGSAVEVDENYLRESLLDPAARVVAGYQPVMPTYGSLNERQVNALIEFIKEQSP